MTPQQRAEYVEAVTLNIDGVYPGKVRDAERIVDRVIAPALAYVWDEAFMAGQIDEFDAREGDEHEETPNPYLEAAP